MTMDRSEKFTFSILSVTEQSPSSPIIPSTVTLRSWIFCSARSKYIFSLILLPWKDNRLKIFLSIISILQFKPYLYIVYNSNMKNLAVTHKIEAFKCQIRKNHRESYRKTVRSKFTDHERVGSLANSIITTFHYDKSMISELNHLLHHININQVPSSTLAILKQLIPVLTALCEEGNIPSSIHRQCVEIFCLMTAYKEFGQDLNLDVISLIAEELCNYICPRHIFYDCLLAMSNLLSPGARLGSRCFVALNKIGIQTILYSILSTSNQLKMGEVQEQKQSEKQEIVFWFLYKYVRYICLNDELQFEHKKLPYEIILCVNLELAKCHRGGIGNEVQVNKFKSIVGIIESASIRFSDQFIMDVILPLIKNNWEREEFAKIWKYLTESMPSSVLTVELLTNLLKVIAESENHMKTKKRDRDLLAGVLNLMENLEENEAQEIWNSCMTGGLEKRKDLWREFERIQSYFGYKE